MILSLMNESKKYTLNIINLAQRRLDYDLYLDGFIRFKIKCNEVNELYLKNNNKKASESMLF